MATNTDNRTRARWPIAALGVAIGAVIGGVTLLTSALAVHQPSAPFELDGNPTQTTADDDWNNVFELPTPYPTPRDLPTVGGAETFVVDGNNLPGGKESTAWKGSNKDIDTIATWEYESSKVTPDKDNITNAYAKAYPVGGFPAPNPQHLIIYFGADRFANSGDAALGFWFFKDNVSLDTGGKFKGEHEVGDILVQVDFVSGGKSSEVQIFQWVGSGGSHGSLDEIVPATGSNGFEVCTAGDTACAITNNTATASPWAYTPKSGASNTFPSESFFEAGIDVTALVGEVCFSSFMAETRSSHSETAELKDLALGDFNLCSIELTRKECAAEAGVSPLFNFNTGRYQTKHTVTITNDGFGPLFDLSLRDIDVGANTSCDLIEVDDVPLNPVQAFPAGTPDADAAYLPLGIDLLAGEVVTVKVLCKSTENPLENSVEVRAAAAPGGSPDVTSTYDQVDADIRPHCVATLDPRLVLTKDCKGVTLDPANGFKPKVCADITVQNTSVPAQRVTLTSWDNKHSDGVVTQNLLTMIPAGQDAILDPNETITISNLCYNPAPDDLATNPCDVAFTDVVSARGTAQVGGTLVVPSDASDSCELCPCD
ncbi:MAG TPA: hypothetical protein VGD21_12190 [Lysobacter sp.]